MAKAEGGLWVFEGVCREIGVFQPSRDINELNVNIRFCIFFNEFEYGFAPLRVLKNKGEY